MTKEFKDKNYWAIVLGSSSGLGLAAAKKLAEHGMNICAVYRIPRHQEEALAQEFSVIKNHGVRLKTFNLDAVNPAKRQMVIDDMKQALNPNGTIKTLVHSLAKGNLKPMITNNGNTLKNDDFTLTINAMGVSLYDWAKTLFEAQLFSEDARVISFTSEGNSKAWQNYAAVSAAKVTLEAITRSLALEFAPFGIKANCIQAGVTDTNSLRMIPKSDELMAHSLKRNPNNRLTTPEDVANVVYLLNKDEANWITGTIIPVDGGEHLR